MRNLIDWSPRRVLILNYLIVADEAHKWMHKPDNEDIRGNFKISDKIAEIAHRLLIRFDGWGISYTEFQDVF